MFWRLDCHIVIDLQRFRCLWNHAVERLRGSPDLWQYSRIGPVHVQERSRLQRGGTEVRELVDSRHLRTGWTWLLLSGIDFALCCRTALFIWRMHL